MPVIDDAWTSHVLEAEPSVLRRLHRLGLDSGACHDAWQGTVESVLRSGTPPAPERGPRAYLWTAARREGLRILRARRLAPASLPSELRCGAPTPEGLACDRELSMTLHAAVALLPAHFRSVIEQRFFQGRSAGEVARALAIPSNTVASRTHRALRLLRERLNEARGGLGVLLATLGLLAWSTDSTVGERTWARPSRAGQGALATPALAPTSEGERSGVRCVTSAASHLPIDGLLPYADGLVWAPRPLPES